NAKSEHLFDYDFQHYGVVKRERSEKIPPYGLNTSLCCGAGECDPPPKLQDLRRRTTDACASVTPAMLHNVQREIQSRVQKGIVANGAI
ncbi:hypothetical protein AVEN_16615-1, partial [Araneus ventricosus]